MSCFFSVAQKRVQNGTAESAQRKNGKLGRISFLQRFAEFLGIHPYEIINSGIAHEVFPDGVRRFYKAVVEGDFLLDQRTAVGQLVVVVEHLKLAVLR